jgi:hypothetical protein
MTLKYFWTFRKDLPHRMGYQHFTPKHLFMLALIGILVWWLSGKFARADRKTQERVLKVIPVVMLVMETCKDMLLYREGWFSVNYLPLQLCSLGAFVFLIHAYARPGKVRAFFAEVAFVLIMPASLCALFFPNWNTYYPLLNFFSIHSYTWHFLLLLYPWCLKRAGMVEPRMSHIWYEVLFLCCVVPPVLIFDKHFHVNFMFVNWPAEGSPLEWMEQVFGNPGYLLPYAIVIFLMLVAVYVPIERARKRREGGGSEKDRTV